MRSCICSTSWCNLARTKHLFGSRTVILTRDLFERDVWANHLEITADEKSYLTTLQDPRVWVGHFHFKDYIISQDAEGNASFESIDFKTITKYRDYDTGRSSLVSPPRPAATKQLVSLSFLSDSRSISFSDYLLQNGSLGSQRGKTKNVTDKNLIKTPVTSTPLGRAISVPYFEFFIGMSEHIISMMRSMNLHGQSCGGSLHFRRSEVTTRRFALTVRCTCSLGKDCKFWSLGVYRWQSTSDIKISSTRSVPVPDVLYALGVSMTPNTMAHSDQLLTSMMLTPPSRNLLKDIMKLVVDPYLLIEKDRLVQEACGTIRDSGVSPVLCMDVGHSSARNSQAATLAAASGNILLFTLTDTKTNAWLKETALVERALDFAINTEKLDVSMIEIDDNSKNASIISTYSRVNGPEESKSEPVKAGIDVFHAAKAMGKHVIKINAENLVILEKFFKPLCEQTFGIEDTIKRINEMIMSKSNDFFSNIMSSFNDLGADAWRIASATPESMRAFATTNNLVDASENYSLWMPVVSAWNLSFPGKNNLISVTKMKVTMTLSTKTLRNLATAVAEVTGIPIISIDKTNEKSELFMYMKRNLPDICYRGSNISIDLNGVAHDLQQIIKDLPVSGTISHVSPEETLMVQVFGTQNRTLRTLRTLKADKLSLLSKHLAIKMEVDAPVKASQIKSFCVLNFWRINCLWDDVHEAMTIAQRAFNSRLGEFKRTMKNLLRVVNEMFGDSSMKFKMCFLINGLLNFVDHYSDEHKSCARYFWWTQCGDTHIKYVPTQEYCTVLSSGRGPGCRDLIPSFFRIFVTAFVMSKYAESQFWKCLCFSKTTICESYFHWKSIIIPKWQNIPAGEYERKERAAFITFVKRQKEKLFLMKKLVTNKYANTLTVASAQKNSRYEKHILDAVENICCACPTVLSAVDHFAKKCNARHEKRQNLLQEVTVKYEEDETARNLNLGPVKHEIRTLDSKGGPPTQSFREYARSARPVAPFPFLNEYLLDDDKKYRLENVWSSSRAIKKSRLEEKDDRQGEIDTFCYFCKSEVDAGKVECSVCMVAAHLDCLENYNSEWEIDSDGVSICKQCNSIDRLTRTS